MKLRHIKHSEIDFDLWDSIISNSANSLIYAYSWYLDVVSPGWEALVSENYEYVMPLTVKKKYGIKHIVQPIFSQQLGVFSAKPITEETVKLFLKSIPYLIYAIQLNEKNFTSKGTKQPNLVLNLAGNYSDLKLSFSENTYRNIRKAEKYNLQVEWDLTTMEFLQIYFCGEKQAKLNCKNLIHNMVIRGADNQSITLAGVRSEGKLISALGFFISNNRLYYILPVSLKEGKQKSAMFLLVDEIIKKFSGSDYILDFEGSKLEGVARFYAGFGAKLIPYYSIKRLYKSL